MIILDDLLIGGLRFVLDKVASAVDAEMNDADRLREDLLAAQMQLELGEITDEEFAEVESEVLVRMRELREQRGGAQAAGAVSLAGGSFGVDVTFGGDDSEGGSRPPRPPGE
ncbi:MAG TPA: gas vesicle protein GvpG [Thermoanaerobaculia bacterium]|nr:gas vesicle protein GvpG [Thermoanaerobaculia bacterium]